jgi:hypothetical protein
MVREKGDWYAFGEGDNPTLKTRIIDGMRFHRSLIYINKRDAESHAKGLRHMGYHVRIVPLMLWGKLFGYSSSIPHKNRAYVVFIHKP